MTQLSYYEFFCGGGMARAGLGAPWRCLFANDIDAKKAKSYRDNWPAEPLRLADVNDLATADLPDRADLAWASFPCQDLSLAGGGRGLKGERSGTFWPFWSLMKGLRQEGRAPRLIALENVVGTLTSRKGADFQALCAALDDIGYRFGAMVIDAKEFLPQSRPRLFLVALSADEGSPLGLVGDRPCARWSNAALLRAHKALPKDLSRRWLWWRPPPPAEARGRLSDIVGEEPQSVRWHSPDETARLLSLMSPTNRAKVDRAKRARRRIVGALYRRTRVEDGVKTQRAEVRFDELAGCLRTPAGGSSRQTILVVHGDSVRSRLIDAREAASLMGLPRSYALPAKYNDAYHLVGDGVVVDVVRHLSQHLFEPVLTGAPSGVAPRGMDADPIQEPFAATG